MVITSKILETAICHIVQDIWPVLAKSQCKHVHLNFNATCSCDIVIALIPCHVFLDQVDGFSSL